MAKLQDIELIYKMNIFERILATIFTIICLGSLLIHLFTRSNYQYEKDIVKDAIIEANAEMNKNK